jgi:hypothetical protein
VRWSFKALHPPHAAVALAALWVTLGVLCLKQYGLTIDSPGIFYAGDRTLYWLEHPTLPGALDFKRDPPPGFASSFASFPSWDAPLHYPVLPGLLAAAASRVFHDRLHGLTVLDGHHLGLVLLDGIALLLFCAYANALLGPPAGIAATIVLMFFPAAMGHFINNPVDWPCALWYGVAILAGGVGALRGQARHVWAASLFAGLALSCKLTGIFAWITLLLWTPLAYLLLYRGQRKPGTPLVTACFGGPYLSLAVFVLLWPWLLQGGTPSAWWGHLSEYIRFTLDDGVGPRQTWVAYPFRCLIFMAPPLVLAAASGFAALGWRASRERRAVWSLLLLWLLLPLVRTAMPHSNFYDGNRHFLEYVPALAALAGAGIVGAGRWAKHRLGTLGQRRGLPNLAGAVLISAALLALTAMLWPILEYHPFEASYFNDLIGGLGGAQRRSLLSVPPPHDGRVNGAEGDYWYSSLRQALRGLYPKAKVGETIAAFNRYAEPQIVLDWPGPNAPELADVRAATYVYASPRGGSCSWADLQRLEADRPVLARAERGGGLIYELFGPSRASPRPAAIDPRSANPP